MKLNVISTVLVSFCLPMICIGVPRVTVNLAKPTPQQLAFQDMEVGAFIHFGLNVYTGQEHGDGFEPASKFNPKQLDAEQWVRTAKALGAKYAVLTARHEGGFCLWPTKTTDYSIASSPYKGGKGDIVREFVDACHKYGIKPGLYLTASHDAHHTYKPEDQGHVPWGPVGDAVREKRFAEMGEAGRQKYIQMQVEQIRELLTHYGDLVYFWFDHWNAAPTSPTDGPWTIAGSACWRAVTEEVWKLQPNCLMMGPDTWVPGNERGLVVYPMWNAVNTVDGTIWSRATPTGADEQVPNDYGLLETDALTGHPLGKFWRPRECTTNTGFNRGGWFWHPNETKALTLPEHLNLYYRTVGLGANIIINLPPDGCGLIPDDIAKSAQVFGEEIRRRFAHPIAARTAVTSDEVIELDWKEPKKINTVVTMENIANGQKIARYTLEAMVDGQWQALKPQNKLRGGKPYNNNPGYETIGHKKIDRVAPVTTDRIRFRCLKAVAQPVEIRSLTVFNCALLKEKSHQK